MIALRFAVWLVLGCLMGVSGQAFAAQVMVVMSENSSPYQDIYRAIRAHLDGTGNAVSQIYVEGLSASSLNEANLIVAVGVRAADALPARSIHSPVLAVLVPRTWYVKTGHARLSENGSRSMSAIYLDQPFERQARLIRLAFPDARRVGVLLSAEQGWLIGELDGVLRSQQLSLAHVTLAEDERLLAPLENVLSEADVLLAVPDPLVFNRNTAQSIFLTTYRYRVPVMGYSRSMTGAGALLSLYSSPAQIGRQTAEWVRNALKNVPVRLPAPAYPAYFDISINEQVARSLGFPLPLEDELEKRMGGGR